MMNSNIIDYDDLYHFIDINISDDNSKTPTTHNPDLLKSDISEIKMDFIFDFEEEWERKKCRRERRRRNRETRDRSGQVKGQAANAKCGRNKGARLGERQARRLPE